MDTEFPNHFFIYPIAEEAIGDDYGEYVYANPVKVGRRVSELYVTDCWLVNQDGERHPDYSASPIPIRIRHLGNHLRGVYIVRQRGRVVVSKSPPVDW